MDTELVNAELDLSNAKFSYSDIQASIQYAFDSVSVLPSEVGLRVYGELIHEKMVEYLNKKLYE